MKKSEIKPMMHIIRDNIDTIALEYVHDNDRGGSDSFKVELKLRELEKDNDKSANDGNNNSINDIDSRDRVHDD